MNKTTLSLLSAAVIQCIALPALSFDGGDLVLRAGLTSVQPDGGSENVMVPDLGGDTGMKVEVGDNTQLGLNVAYFYSPSWAIELLAATPFQHDIELKNSALGLGDGDLAEVNHLPPTISALYYPMSNDSTFQPYVGVGLNYTVFFDEEFTSNRKDQGFSNLSLDSSFGFALQIGADLMLNEAWLINASIRYIDIGTTAEFDVGASKGSVDVDIDPMVYSLTAGYKF